MRLSGTCNISDGNIMMCRQLLTLARKHFYNFVPRSTLSASQWISCSCGNTQMFIHHFSSQDPAIGDSIPGPNQLNSYLPFVTYSNPFNMSGFIQIFEPKLCMNSFLLYSCYKSNPYSMYILQSYHWNSFHLPHTKTYVDCMLEVSGIKVHYCRRLVYFSKYWIQ